MKRRRAIYIKEPLAVEVWKNGRQPNLILHFGMTGNYIGDTFMADDLEYPALTIQENDLFFPRL